MVRYTSALLFWGNSYVSALDNTARQYLHNGRGFMMKKADCWLSFSGALEQYLRARACAQNGTAGWKQAPEEMRVAAEHMDALTGSTPDEG